MKTKLKPNRKHVGENFEFCISFETMEKHLDAVKCFDQCLKIIEKVKMIL